jgi:hypothetical protein
MKNKEFIIICLVVGFTFCLGCINSSEQNPPITTTASVTPQVTTSFPTTTATTITTASVYYPPGQGPEAGHYYTGSGTNPFEPAANTALICGRCMNGVGILEECLNLSEKCRMTRENMKYLYCRTSSC